MTQRKSIWLKPDLLKKFDDFMSLTESKDIKQIHGKATLSSSYSKSARYLIEALLDERTFNNRGKFEFCLKEIEKFTQSIRETGIKLDQAVKAYASGEPPNMNISALFSELKGLLDSNHQILGNFDETFNVDTSE
jgi:hypothetical protein